MPPTPVKQPDAALIIGRAILAALAECAPIVRNYALASLDRVLRRKSGQLATSIYTKLGRARRGGRLTIGTPVHYGRFWEFGFKRGGKVFRRPWLRPAVDEAMPDVMRRVETHLNRAMSQFTGTVSIDIKIT